MEGCVFNSASLFSIRVYACSCICGRSVCFLLCFLAFVVGSSPGVPPGLTFGQGQVWEEGSQGTLDLVRLTAQSMLCRAVVRTLPIETDVVGWEIRVYMNGFVGDIDLFIWWSIASSTVHKLKCS